jgi:cell division protein FtsI (penicillin-binding protein 3)
MAEKKKDILWRIYVVFFAFLLFALAIMSKVGHLQFVEGDYWKRKADSLTTAYQSIEPIRGNIYASDGSLIATSLPRYDVHLDMCSNGLKNKVFNDGIDSLALCLNKLFKDKSKSDYKRILKEARREGNHYLLLKRNISYKEQKQLMTFPILRYGRNKGGLIVDQLSKREKPFKDLASRTIGSKSENQNVKAVGIEGAFDSSLRGVKGKRLMQRIAGNVWKPVNNENEIEPKDGNDVITTIDLNLQDVATSALSEQILKSKAEKGCAILMEVATGEIKAIANLTRKGDNETINYREDYNYAIGYGTEPGSTYKLISMMAMMEDGYIDLQDSINTNGGRMMLAGGKPLVDSHEGIYNYLDVKDAFAHSSNVAVAKLVMKYYSKNPQKFVDRMRSFHLEDDMHLQIPGEKKFTMKNADSKYWSALSLPLTAIGYEQNMTPIQILTFYNAVANDGKMVAPIFVKEIRSKSQLVKRYPIQVIADSICSASTIKMAQEMLEEVVLTGTAKHIKHSQYTIAGKTGTAQIANDSKGYNGVDGKQYQASFCGYFPADKPQYSCIVVIYKPSKEAYYGASVACPVFKEISDKVYALNIKMHEELKRSPDSLFAGNAVVKAGRNNPTLLAAKRLNMPLSIPNSGWHNTSLRELKSSEGAVPNVVGMGLRDAIYILENQGLQVKPQGRGSVIKQSLNAGTKVQKGQQIIIELG